VGSATSVAALVYVKKKKTKCALFGCWHYMHLLTRRAEGVGTERNGTERNATDFG
jgi:hypothetical protein